MCKSAQVCGSCDAQRVFVLSFLVGPPAVPRPFVHEDVRCGYAFFFLSERKVRTCSLLVVAGFLGLEPLEHVTVLVGVVPAAESIAPDESEGMGFATVFWVLGSCTASVFPGSPIKHWIVDYFGGEGSFAVWPSTPLFTRVAGQSSREMLVSIVDTRLSLKPLEDFHTFSLARGIRCGCRFSSCSPEPDQSGLVCVLVARTSLLVWGNTRTPDLSDVGS